MKKVIFLAIWTAALTGCVTTSETVWGPGMTTGDRSLRLDMFECKRDSALIRQAQKKDNHWLSEVFDEAKETLNYENCMQGKGWTKQVVTKN